MQKASMKCAGIKMICRNCQNEIKITFIDLGFAPYSNEYLNEIDLSKYEKHYPLKVMLCNSCWLVQTAYYEKSEDLFKEDYSYQSSTSTYWLEHANSFVNKIIKKLELSENSFVIEIASNDGYLLKNFVEKNIPCLGIEPAKKVAELAEKSGVKTVKEFFTSKLSREILETNKKPNLIIGNNVLAHVPDIVDFAYGLQNLLSYRGTACFEFPHIMNLIKYNQYDTIYHEHYSYLSLISISNIFNKVGLDIYDVEKLETHGGSLRIYACHAGEKDILSSVIDLINCEKEFGLESEEIYESLKNKALKNKFEFIEFLIGARKKNKIVVGCGAAAKGNTILNYAGIKNDLISKIFDAAEFKQNKYLPGSHIKIHPYDRIVDIKPDYAIIFPWNIYDEITSNLSFLKSTGTKFVRIIPELIIE